MLTQTDVTATAIPPAVRRNHWMNQVLTHAQSRPDARAFSHRGQVTSWTDFAVHMTAFAAALSRRGVRPGHRVLLLTLNRTEVLEAMLGINHVGAIAVPMNVRLAPAEIAYVVDDADGDVLVVEALLLPLVGAVAQLTDRIRRVVVIGGTVEDLPQAESFDDLIAEDVAGWEPPDVPEDSTCLIMYTSGTTGRPKGAMLDHGNLQAQALTCIRANDLGDESDVGFLTAPLFHIAGIGALAPSFVLGTPTVLHPLGAFDPTAVIDAWEREGATVVFNVPQQWQLICADPTLPGRDLKLRVISWGAAPASETLLRAMGDAFPRAVNVAVFGQTEMSPITCLLKGEDSLRRLGSVGRPIPTIQYRVVDEQMNDVPRGMVGEIVYRGPTLMQGYWRKPVETAEAFAGGWFHSGDLVRQDDEGFVWVVDRKKDMIISGGENIYGPEVENALAAHPHILEAAVVGRADERWGEVPVAVAVLRPDTGLTLDELTEWLAPRLARFKQPAELILMEALPRNAAGKVDKVLLRGRT